jgi:hypothetical protein
MVVTSHSSSRGEPSLPVTRFVPGRRTRLRVPPSLITES